MEFLDKVKRKAADCSIFKDYRFDRFVGRGGYGRVFEAFSYLYQKKFAIKIYSKSDRSESTSNKLQRNEADLLKRINHKNIIKIYDYLETKHFIFVVTEFCEAGDLWQVLERYQKMTKSKSMPEKLASQIVSQLVDGLIYLKEACVVHRDLKPGSP